MGKQPRAHVPPHLPGAEDLGDGAVGLSAPDLQLEEAIPGGVEPLGKEEILFGIGVDVGDAPAIGDDLHRPLQSRKPEGLLRSRQ
jgi:hypothetical protein